MLGYYLDKNNYSTSCLRFHDKLLNNLDQKHCDKWGMPRCEGVPLIEVVDSLNSTKTKKVFHSLKKFKGVRFITDQVEVVNKEYVKHTICYEGQPCVVVYKRRFEDNLLGGGRWYNIGTFQVESSSGRNTITIDGECTIEIDLHCLHPSLLASSVGFKLPDNFDPYDISHMVTKGVDKKILRNFMKPCFMSLIYGTSRNTALHEIRTHLWNNKKIASWLDEYTILNCLEEHNHCLHKFFYKKEQWKYCQYIDSCIATDIMLHFALKGEVCLNYHDSWRVAARLQLELIEVMKESWRKHVGDLGNFKYDYKD